MRDQTVPCILEGLQQQRRQLVERGKVGAQLGALGSLQTVTWVTIDVLLLFSSLPWHLVVCAAVVAPQWWVVQQTDTIQWQFRSLVLHMALVYPCSHSGAGECKAACLIGLALAWYAAEPLCCAPCMHTHTHPCIMQHSGAA